MANYTIFNLENNDIEGENIQKINIDELFEKKKEHGLREFNLFNKLLNRIHIKIKLTSKQKINEPYIWFIVPEIIIGYPKYDISSCILFLIDNLKKNKFLVKYYHPNTLLIYWGHYYASYIRDEIKNKFGVKINEFGEKIIEENTKEENKNFELEYLQQNKQQPLSKKKENKNKYTDIKTYNPTGNLFYNEILSLSKNDI